MGYDRCRFLRSAHARVLCHSKLTVPVVHQEIIQIRQKKLDNRRCNSYNNSATYVLCQNDYVAKK